MICPPRRNKALLSSLFNTIVAEVKIETYPTVRDTSLRGPSGCFSEGNFAHHISNITILTLE